jgi:hypothetical protein
MPPKGRYALILRANRLTQFVDPDVAGLLSRIAPMDDAMIARGSDGRTLRRSVNIKPRADCV